MTRLDIVTDSELDSSGFTAPLPAPVVMAGGHPDQGGDPRKFAEMSAALAEAEAAAA